MGHHAFCIHDMEKHPDLPAFMHDISLEQLNTLGLKSTTMRTAAADQYYFIYYIYKCRGFVGGVGRSKDKEILRHPGFVFMLAFSGLTCKQLLLHLSYHYCSKKCVVTRSSNTL